MKSWFIATLVVFGIMVPTFAAAQDCKKIDKNPDWMEGITAMKDAYDNQDYDSVLTAARPIYSICPDSPSYLYYLARAFEGKGDVAKAREYIYKASDATYKYATTPQMSQMIWYARYEIDNPERTPEAVEAMKAEIESLKQSSLDLADGASQSENLAEQLESVRNSDKEKLYIGTWTGAGIGIAGLALAAVGAGLFAKDTGEDVLGADSRIESRGDSSFPHKYEKVYVKSTYTTGVALLGAGIGIAVAGAIVTGIMGYQYMHFDDDKSVSVSLGLNQANVSLKF